MSAQVQARISDYRAGALTVDLYVLDCSACGVIFAITREYEKNRRSDAKGFHCPNGHVLSWSETDVDRERKRALAAEKRAERAEADRSRYQEWLRNEREEHRTTQRSLAATKGVVTRTKKRIGNGVCPCCNRHFSNVERHMKVQHPGYVIDAPAEATS